MRICSCFVDESGSFGNVYSNSPYYIVSLVFHDQDDYIAPNLKRLSDDVRLLGYPVHAVHTVPLVRREGDYEFENTVRRKQLFNRLFNFARNASFTYCNLVVDKRKLDDPVMLDAMLSRQLMECVNRNLAWFQSFDKIIVYYDNGQNEVRRILSAVIGGMLMNVSIKKIIPVDYRLVQVADLLCTLELVTLKANEKTLSASEKTFFGSAKDIRRHYVQHLLGKRR
jgi:hypothetical protein